MHVWNIMFNLYSHCWNRNKYSKLSDISCIQQKCVIICSDILTSNIRAISCNLSVCKWVYVGIIWNVSLFLAKPRQRCVMHCFISVASQTFIPNLKVHQDAGSLEVITSNILLWLVWYTLPYNSYCKRYTTNLVQLIQLEILIQSCCTNQIIKFLGHGGSWRV